MSLKTWKAEFYPITALQAAKTLDVVGLIDHALQKWEGLKSKNRAKHDIAAYGLGISDGEYSLDIDASTCSLCRKFLSLKITEFTDKDCVGCPIFESRGKVRCFECSPNEKIVESPYGHWLWDGDPMPMIKALRKARKWAKESK